MKFKPPDENRPIQDPEIAAQVTALMVRFGIASQLYQGAMERRLAQHGVTLAQLSVLSHLARNQQRAIGPQRVTQIARAVEVNQPGVTKMLAKFESAGWVRFDTSTTDKRTRAASITPAGLAHLGAIRQGLFPELGQFLAEWPEETRKRFTQDLQYFGEFLDSHRSLDDNG